MAALLATTVQAADHYAELKAAVAAGKTIQTRHPDGYWWVDIVPVLWCLTPDRYRVKPEQPAAEPQSVPYVFFAVGDSSISRETGDQPGSVLEPDATVSAASKLNDAINRLASDCATGDDGPVTAHSVLQRAANHMSARAATYDSPGGERSMDKAVLAFNAITGRDLDESEGWLLLQQLKNVRLFTADGYHKDSAEDATAYTALMAEAKAAEAALDERLLNAAVADLTK